MLSYPSNKVVIDNQLAAISLIRFNKGSIMPDYTEVGYCCTGWLLLPRKAAITNSSVNCNTHFSSPLSQLFFIQMILHITAV